MNRGTAYDLYDMYNRISKIAFRGGDITKMREKLQVIRTIIGGGGGSPLSVKNVVRWHMAKLQEMIKQKEKELGIPEESKRQGRFKKTGKTDRNKAKPNYKSSAQRKAERSARDRALRQQMQGRKGS